MGGSTRAAIRTANALARRNHTVHLIMPGSPLWELEKSVQLWRCASSESSLRGNLYSCWNALDRSLFKRVLRRVIDTHALEIIHYHYAEPFAEVIADLSRTTSMPLTIGTFHGTDLTRCVSDSPYRRRIECALESTQVCTIASLAMQKLAEKAFRRKRAFHLIPNFLPDYWTKRPRITAAPTEPIRVLHVSNFRDVKNTLGIVEFCVEMGRSKNLEVILLGQGPDLDIVRQQFQSSNTPCDTVTLVRSCGCLVFLFTIDWCLEFPTTCSIGNRHLSSRLLIGATRHEFWLDSLVSHTITQSVTSASSPVPASSDFQVNASPQTCGAFWVTIANASTEPKI